MKITSKKYIVITATSPFRFLNTAGELSDTLDEAFEFCSEASAMACVSETDNPDDYSVMEAELVFEI